MTLTYAAQIAGLFFGPLAVGDRHISAGDRGGPVRPDGRHNGHGDYLSRGIWSGGPIHDPWSDQAGRKSPFCFGMALFAVAPVGCALAPSMEVLMFFRVLNGLGGAALQVLSRALIGDLQKGSEAMRVMALVTLAAWVSPMIALLVGSGLMAPARGA